MKQQQKTPPFDVILVLAGGITDQEKLPLGVKKRIHVAKKLYGDGFASKILMSGKWSSHWDHEPPRTTESQLMKTYAIGLRVPEEDILTEEYSQNTKENILYSTKLFFEPHGWKKILVITSSFHKNRVLFLLRQNLSQQYMFDVFTAESPGSMYLQLQRFCKEFLLLHTERFLQKIFDRH